MTLKVILADDHPLVLLGIRMSLEHEPDIEICGEAASSTELVELMDRVRPDILISDFYMPDGAHGDGLSLVTFVKRRYPHVKLIILTMMMNASILEKIVAVGVDGVLLKSGRKTDVVDAIRFVSFGHKYIGVEVKKILHEFRMDHTSAKGKFDKKALSKKESEVLRLYVAGRTVSEIAIILSRSVKTISHQKISAQQKLGIANENQLYEYAMKNGLL
ncbi:response regulator [Pseudomonas putida]|uniref:response regulator n=1 Tax=Pseudomonas putida TaxID=303 RepID=UPI0023662B5E|nr:response regulator [Pseudomonas putida]MDD2050427.1 response regulator [Pseudomonas putida]